MAYCTVQYSTEIRDVPNFKKANCRNMDGIIWILSILIPTPVLPINSDAYGHSYWWNSLEFTAKIRHDNIKWYDVLTLIFQSCCLVIFRYLMPWQRRSGGWMCLWMTSIWTFTHRPWCWKSIRMWVKDTFTVIIYVLLMLLVLHILIANVIALKFPASNKLISDISVSLVFMCSTQQSSSQAYSWLNVV